MMSDKKELVVVRFQQIRANCNYGKGKHSYAAQRKNLYDNFLLIPGAIFTTVVGSSFFATLSNDLPDATKWAGGILGLLSTVLITARSLLKFTQDVEAHRMTTNEFRLLGEKCTNLILRIESNSLDVEEALNKVDEYTEIYENICSCAEKYSTSNSDYKKTKKDIERRQTQYKATDLEILEKDE